MVGGMRCFASYESRKHVLDLHRSNLNTREGAVHNSWDIDNCFPLMEIGDDGFGIEMCCWSSTSAIGWLLFEISLLIRSGVKTRKDYRDGYAAPRAVGH